MAPDQIKEIAESAFPELVTVKRENPDGWSFYWREVKKGNNPTRIFRVISSSSRGKLKWAISERLHRPNTVEYWNSSSEELRQRIQREIDLWREHFN